MHCIPQLQRDSGILRSFFSPLVALITTLPCLTIPHYTFGTTLPYLAYSKVTGRDTSGLGCHRIESRLHIRFFL